MLAEKAQPIVDDIGKKLASSDGAVHADETYWTTNGARSYFRVHADANFVLFQYDTSRSGQVSRDILGDDFLGRLVTDCYAGYTASAAAKQKCLAHLARTARDWQKLTVADSADRTMLILSAIFAHAGIVPLSTMPGIGVFATPNGPRYSNGDSGFGFHAS
jgi:hypothetical protein